MNLIVFDLEWNIGYQPKTFLYHGTELTLRGEIIQLRQDLTAALANIAGNTGKTAQVLENVSAASGGDSLQMSAVG